MYVLQYFCRVELHLCKYMYVYLRMIYYCKLENIHAILIVAYAHLDRLRTTIRLAPRADGLTRVQSFFFTY